MANINDQDLLDEIRYDIKVKDLRKAQLVLCSLEHVSRDTQKKALLEVSRSDEDFSIPLLAGVFISKPNIAESFPQLKETMFSKLLSRPKVLLDMLAKANDAGSRTFLADIAAEIRLEDAAPLLQGFLKKEKDPKAIESIILALGAIGVSSSVAIISDYLGAPIQKVTVAAVRALGELATPEAMEKLASKLGDDPNVDLLIIAIFARVQTPEALEKLNETLSSPHAHIRTAGKKKLSEIGEMGIRVLIKNLPRKNPDLVIHSLNVLGDIGNSAAIPAIRKLLLNEPKDANVRFAAYETLGRLPVEKGAFALAAGLEDPVDNVRAAAAKAIDRNYNAVLAGGLRNLMRSSEAEAQRIAETVVNSQCDHIFSDLLEEDLFRLNAINYLSTKAHPELRIYYADLLSEAGLSDLAKKIFVKEKVVKGKEKLRVVAVDDSRMILNIYRTVLHNLGCESFTFEFPAAAIEHVNKERPDVILTDLNMPDITGIELTSVVRQSYSKEQLPIIMVTTQSEGQDNKAALAAGVNGIVQKPFTEDIIGKALAKFAGFTGRK